MDPEANIREQREIQRTGGSKARLRELKQALAEWRSMGGFMPKVPRHHKSKPEGLTPPKAGT